ncbi:DUF563 domain-containing protein [Mangrovimonas sp. DI 80]|uniref:glycosyltransferase family 61 protein n=1 Tax=Mangrovimonas sp. DI 80 TaxID=1779330 RepID=UPI000F5113F0|nr:glycosyltransferase family 61 protein [Mangrovimonas sp. DI 80]
MLHPITVLGSENREVTNLKVRDITGERLAFIKGSMPLTPHYYSILTNSILYTLDGFVQNSDGTFLRDTYWTDIMLLEHGLLKHRRSLFYKKLKGNYFSLLLFYSWGYYHWFCDVLPRYVMFMETYGHAIRSLNILIQKNPPSWMKNSLELLNYNVHYVEFDGVYPVKIEILHFIPPLSMTGDHDPKWLNKVRQGLLKNISVQHDKQSLKRLYISRSKAPSRKLKNEAALCELLKKFGFEMIHAEDISYLEQIKLFSNAEWLVAPHGAGLTNMLYMPKGAQVLELFSKNTLRRCYFTMAQTLGIQYHSLFLMPSDELKTGTDLIVEDIQLKALFEFLKHKIKTSI